MERNLLIGIVAVVIAIVIIAVTAIFLLNDQGPQENKNLPLEVGDFLTYEYTNRVSKNETQTGNQTY